MSTYKCKIKQEARSLALSTSRRKKTFLCMPGEFCYCVIQALENGTINRNSFIIFVENGIGARGPVVSMRLRRNLYRKIYRTLKSLGLNNVMGHFGELEDLRLPPNSIDFAFIDCCGELTEVKEDWLKNHLLPCLTKRAIVSTTFSATMRSKHGKRLVKKFPKKKPAIKSFVLPDHIQATLRKIFRGCKASSFIFYKAEDAIHHMITSRFSI